VAVQNTSTHNMTPPRSFAHFVRSWVCGGRYGFNDETVIRRDKRKRRRPHRKAFYHRLRPPAWIHI